MTIYPLALTIAGIALAYLGLDHQNGMPRLLPYNLIAVVLPPMAMVCIAMGLSMMVGEVSGR